MSFNNVQDGMWNNPDVCDFVSPLDKYNSQILMDTASQMPAQLSGSPAHLQYPYEGHYSSPDASSHGPQVGDFEEAKYSNRSVSLISSPSGSNPVAPAPETKTMAKAKRPRGKVLNEEEQELLLKDDSLLTEDQLVIKRKAQNRVAQRAFRERKESKLRELESKLLESEDERQKLREQLEEIKAHYISMRTENELLRSNPESLGNTSLDMSKFTFPKSQEAFVEQMMVGQNHEMNAATIDKIYEEPLHPGRKVLAVGAVWDYLQIKKEEEEYENVDLIEVMQLLKGREVCHGYGPAYPLDCVEQTLSKVASKYCP